MKSKFMSKVASIVVGAAVSVGVALSSWGVPISFELYPTGNDNPDIYGQLVLNVSQVGSQALFTLENKGGIASTITEVLFYDGALLGISDVIGSDGVNFT